ncbi:hypothetical protein AB0F17_59735 [Nonomuraea sp. NPDC026600]|uniref:hypothetical protein n=1 Tax=Nonomuraea sp. NPDC026600 TaxID=3155363 RepID=UPI00340E46A4
MTTTPLVQIPFPTLAELAADRPLADVEIVVTTTNPSYHGQTEFRIRPGVVDADTVELFGFSQCTVLARAMNERTGWAFALVEQFIDGAWTWAHVGVLTPAGRMLDIHGVRELGEVESQMLAEYGHPARVRVLPTLAALADAITPGSSVQHWTSDITNTMGVEIVAVLAELLTVQASEGGA